MRHRPAPPSTPAALALLALAATALVAPTVASAQPRPGAAAARAELTWYGHAAFVLRTPGGTVLAIDPWFGNPRSPDRDAAAKLEKVDYVLVTHGHGDHVGDAIALAQRTGARLIATSDLGKALVRGGFPEKQATNETLGNVGGTIAAGDATVTIVPAVHSSDFADQQNAHVGGGNPVGFVIRMKGGPTLYHTGDTDVTSEMRLVPERHGAVDYLLACIGGHFTMDPAGAALAATYVKARTVIPMHFGTFPLLRGTPAELESALKGKAKVRVLEPGKAAAL